MRRVVLLVLLAGCASGGQTGQTVTDKAPIIYGGDQSTPMMIGEKPRAAIATIAAPPAAVWTAAKQAYASLEIPLGVENPAEHQLGNTNFYKARSIGGEPMTQFVDCGSGMTGLKAASYRIYMSMVSVISADGKGGTTMQTTFTALGQDVSAGSSDRIPCGSTGRLEQLLLDRTKAAMVPR